MAKIDITRQTRAPQTASVYIRTTAVTSSVTGEFELEFVPITGISGSGVTAHLVSGSLGANAVFIRGLTEAKVSGSFTAASSSISSRLTTAETELSNVLVSGSSQIKSLLPSGTISSSAQLGSVVSSSAQLATAISGSLGQNAGLIRTLTGPIISGSFTALSSSLSGRLKTAETELSLTLLSGSDQVKSLLPSGTISSSAQISSLPKMENRELRVTNIGGVDVQNLQNAMSQSKLFNGQILKFNAANQEFEPAFITTPGVSSGSLQSLTDVASEGTASVPGQFVVFDGNSFEPVSMSGDVSMSAEGRVTVTGGAGSGQIDGNRAVSNTLLGDLAGFTPNTGVTGSVTAFLEEIFYKNNPPSFSGSRMTINEFEVQGTSLGNLTGSDSEQGRTSLTYSTQSSYTADKFRIHSGSGEVTVQATTTASLNVTNRGDGVLTHEFPVQLSDGFATTSASVFIRITPNTAPKFRTTSAAGSIVTNQTGSVLEATTSGSAVLTFFVTDSESDTTTISPLSQSSHNHFAMATSSVSGGKRIIISSTTASFDFEDKTQYKMFVSASDQHHNGTTRNYLTTLPIEVNVTNNIAPTMGSQAFSVPERSGSHTDHGQGANTNSQTNIGSITTNDTEGDTVTFTALTLTSGSGKSNANQSNPANDPFQVTSAGVLQLKAGQYLNSDIFNQYKYNASYRDNFNAASSSGVITINITDDIAPTITHNLSSNKAYVIESAVSGANVYQSTNGRSGTQTDFNSNQTVTFSVSSSNDFVINSAGNLSMTASISSSAFTFAAGNAISASVTATNAFGTFVTHSFCVGIAINNAPTPAFSNNASNLNLNGAVSGALISTITFSDTESDALNHSNFVFTDPSNQLNPIKSGDSYLVQAKNDLSASLYPMTASIKDVHGFRTGTTQNSASIATPTTGSLTKNGTFYVIESAVSGAHIKINSNGRTGTQADLGVTYSPNYNSQAVASFTSSNAMVAVNNNGKLTLGQNVSGSIYTNAAGNTISSSITFEDQYNNSGSENITINIAANNAPDITFTPSSPSFDTNQATSGSTLVTLTFSDTEGDSVNLNTFTLQTGSHTPFSFHTSASAILIQPNSNLTAGTYEVTGSIKDSHGFRTNTEDVEIDVVQGASKIFAYKSTRGALGLNGTDSQAINILGDASKDGVDIAADSPIGRFQSGSIASASISVGSGTVTLIASASVTALDFTGSSHSSVRDFGNIDLSGNSGNGHQYIFLFPSGSGFAGKPKTMGSTLSGGNNTAGEYIVWNDNASTDSVDSAGVHYFDLKTGVSFEGYTRYGIVYGLSANTAGTQFFHVIASSGSSPSSEV